jgi:hypothetical protein
VSVRVGVFGSEHRSDFKHLFKVSSNSHLLVELRRLCQERGVSKVLELKDAANTRAGKVAWWDSLGGKTDLAPLSDAAPKILGEWISVKPWPRRNSRNKAPTPDCSDVG